MSYPTSTLKNTISNFSPSYDMPKKGELMVYLTHMNSDENNIVIGNMDFLGYSKTAVPYIEFNNKIYYADTLESISNDDVSMLASCRKYVLAEGETKGSVGEKLVYSFD